MRVKFGLVLCPVYSQASQGLYCSRVDGKSLHQQRQGPRHGDARFVAVAGGRAPVSLTTAVVPPGNPPAAADVRGVGVSGACLFIAGPSPWWRCVESVNRPPVEGHRGGCQFEAVAERAAVNTRALRRGRPGGRLQGRVAIAC